MTDYQLRNFPGDPITHIRVVHLQRLPYTVFLVISVKSRNFIGLRGEMRAVQNMKKSNDRYKAFSMADALKNKHL